MKRSIELRQQRAKIWNDAQALIPAEGRMSAEDGAKFDRMMADMDSMKVEIDRLERSEAMATELNAGVSAGAASSQPGSYAGESTNEDPKQTEERQKRYRKAFGNYLRRGLNNLSQEDLHILRSNGKSAEYRDQDNSNGAAGGFLIPTGFQKELEIALKFFGGMRAAATTLTTSTGAQLPWPTSNDTSKQGRRLGANAVGTPATKNDAAFGQVVFNAWTYTSDVIAVPNELMNDSAFDIAGYVKDRGAERIGRIQNAEFTNLAASSSGPTGFVTVGHVAVTGATGEATSVIYDNIIDLQHGVDPLYRAKSKYMLADTTLQAVRKIKDSYGRPMFGPGLDGGLPDTLAGKPYVINPDMPAMAASAKSIAFGDFSKYVIRDVEGSAVVVRLNELYALNNETGFVMFLRSDGQLLDAGTHPIALYANSAS